MRSSLPIITLSVLLATTASQAQLSPDLIMETYNGNMNAITSAAISNANLRNILEKDRKAGIDPNTGRKTSPSVGLGASLSYSPTRALKTATVQGYIDRLTPKNPAAAQAIATTFGPGKYDYGTIYNGLVKGNGLRENDAVDAMVAYMVLGYMIVHNIQDGNAVTPAMVQGVRTQFGPALAQNAKLTAPGVAAKLGEEMKLQFVVVQGGWQSAIKERNLGQYQQGIASLFKSQWGLDFSSLSLTERGFASTRAPGTSSAPVGSEGPQSVGSRPASYTPSSVEGWYFRAVSGYPAAIRFEPLVLFKNGDYYEPGDQPLEEINPAQAKKNHPEDWGSWQKKGNAYWLTDAKHHVSDYQLGSGNWFPAYAYSPGLSLRRAYERVSGGDYGTGTSALAITTIRFIDATHFSQGQDAGISSGNASGWKKTSGSGTCRLYGHTLELTYGDGKVVKRSFALGAEGNPPKPTNTMIFIGGEAYTDTN